MRPNVVIQNEAKRIYLEVSPTVLATVPLYPGSAGVTANISQNQALAQLDANKAERSEVASTTQLDVLGSSFEETRNKVDGFGGQLDGVKENQTGFGQTLNELDTKVRNFNVSALTGLGINSANELEATYEGEATPRNFGFFPAPATFKGNAVAKPTVASSQGSFYININPAIDVVLWLCTETGDATTAVWTARGGKVYEDMPFEFTANDTYDYPVATPRTVTAPQVWGALATVVWSYAVGTGAFNTAVFPLNMIAGSVLRATVTALAAGAKRYAALARTA